VIGVVWMLLFVNDEAASMRSEVNDTLMRAVIM
jgi:hypothetical protein